MLRRRISNAWPTEASVCCPPLSLVTVGGGSATISEVHAYGDVVLRFVSFNGFHGLDGGGPQACMDYGLQRLDHAAGNVWDLCERVR
ncbi:unnamed protein product [Discosporangium mesarthrocarpum]